MNRSATAHSPDRSYQPAYPVQTAYVTVGYTRANGYPAAGGYQPGYGYPGDQTQPTKRRRRSGRAGTIVIALLIILAGIAVMCYPKFTDLWYQFSQWRLATQATALAADGNGGGGGAPADGSAQGGIMLPDGTVALLEIPAIGFKAYAVEGTGKSALSQGPGHYPGTPLPGEDGNSALAGHRTMYGHPFHDLDRLEPGDEIRTATADGAAVYRVVEVIVVDPEDTHVVEDQGDNRLTLTTCHPKGSAAKRLVVVAERTN